MNFAASSSYLSTYLALLTAPPRPGTIVRDSGWILEFEGSETQISKVIGKGGPR